MKRVSLVRVARSAIVAGALGALTLGAFACVDNTVIPPTNDVDSAFPGVDGGEDSAVVDSGIDASVDARVIDSSAPIDAGKDATVAPAQLGLVAGGTVSHSANYTMTGTTGPATAPVLRSAHYQLVGGMAVTQKP